MRGSRPGLPKGWITVAEAARRLCVSASMITQMANKGVLSRKYRFEHSQRCWGVSEADVSRLVKGCSDAISKVRKEVCK